LKNGTCGELSRSIQIFFGAVVLAAETDPTDAAL
jgi:hypothetical protein